MDKHAAKLLASGSPIARSVPAQLPPPSQLAAPFPEVTFDEFVTAITRLKNNKSPGVCNTLPEMFKCDGTAVHTAMYQIILGIWRNEAAPTDFKQDILIPDPVLQHRTVLQPKLMPMSSECAPLSALDISCLSSSTVSGQTEAVQMLCSAYAVSANQRGTRAPHSTSACWTSPRRLTLSTEAWLGKSC